MIAAIKKQLLTQREDIGVMITLILGGSIFGMILFHVVRFFDSTVSYFPAGTILGAAMAVIFLGVSGLTSLSLYFNMQIAMGSTRKQFFVSFLAAAFVADLIGAAVLMVIAAAEKALVGFLLPELEQEVDILPYLMKWALPAAVGVSILGIFVGALMLRFGKVAFWIFWMIWMFFCVVFPRIMDAAEEAPDSLFGKAGNAFIWLVRRVAVNTWIVIAAAVCAVCVFASWMVLRKQQVTA